MWILCFNICFIQNKYHYEKDAKVFNKREVIRLSNNEQSLWIRFINEYDWDNNFTYTCFDIQNYIKMQFQESILYTQSYHFEEKVKIIIKKRIKKRPNWIYLSNIKLWRKLFVIVLWRLLKPNTLLINIDECIFNYHMSKLYSWSKIGEEKDVYPSWLIIDLFMNSYHF